MQNWIFDIFELSGAMDHGTVYFVPMQQWTKKVGSITQRAPMHTTRTAAFTGRKHNVGNVVVYVLCGIW